MTDTKIPSSTPIAGTKATSSILSPPITGQGNNNAAESSADIPENITKDTIKKEVRVVKGLENIKNETNAPQEVEGHVIRNRPHKHEVDIKTETGIITVEIKIPTPVNTPVSIEIPPDITTKEAQEQYVILEIPQPHDVDIKPVDTVKETTQNTPTLPPSLPLYEGEVVQAVFISTADVNVNVNVHAHAHVETVKEPITVSDNQSLKDPVNTPPKEKLPVTTPLKDETTPIQKNTPVTSTVNIQSQDIELARIIHAGFHVDLTHSRLTAPIQDTPETALKTDISTTAHTIKETPEKTPLPLNNSAYLAQETSRDKASLPPLDSNVLSSFVHDSLDIKQITIEKIILPDALKPSNFSFAHIIESKDPLPPLIEQKENTHQKTPPTQTPSKNILTGIVTGQTPNGFNIISVPKHNAPIILQTTSHVPVGTKITFSIAENSPISTSNIVPNTTEIPNNIPLSGSVESSSGILSANASSPLFASFSPLHSVHWPALENSLQILTEQAPNIAQNLQNSLPTPNARMVPTALFFLAALKMGRIENWLGKKTMDTLQSIDRTGLADKIKSDFSNIARQSKEVLSGDWRSISMPMLQDEQNISNLQFFIRHQIDPDDKNDTEDRGNNQGKKTRFILNLSLSNMGDMQLDGLLRTSQLDIIIRTSDKLDMDTKQQIRDKFQFGLEQTNLQGQITFQAHKENWVTIDTTSQETTNNILT